MAFKNAAICRGAGETSLYYCRCGHATEFDNCIYGSVNDTFWDNSNMRQREFRKSTVCASCGQPGDENVIDIMHNRAEQSLHFVQHFDDSQSLGKISLVFGFSVFKNKSGKLVTFTSRIRLTHNIRTGNTYFVQGGRVSNITLGSMSRPRRTAFEDLISQAAKGENEWEESEWKQAFLDYFKLCMKYRGVTQLGISDFFQGFSYGHSVWESARKLMIYLAFPSLQHFPLVEWGRIPEKIRKQLRSCGGGIEAFKALTGHSGKRVRQLALSSSALFRATCAWGHIFSNEDVLRALLVKAQKSSDRGKEPDSWHDMENQPSNWHVQDVVFDYSHDLAVKSEVFIKVAKFFLSHYKSEHVLYKRLSQLGDLRRMEETLSDAYRMYQEIKLIAPDYPLMLGKDIQRFHDILFKDHREFYNQDVPFCYTEDEKKIETSVDGYQFYLPESSHQLNCIGAFLDFCVGSYSKSVLQKKCLIVAVKRNGEDTLCLELCAPRRGQLAVAQAKGNHNRYPSAEEKAAIEKWAKAVGASYERCHDLLNAS